MNGCEWPRGRCLLVALLGLASACGAPADTVLRVVGVGPDCAPDEDGHVLVGTLDVRTGVGYEANLLFAGTGPESAEFWILDGEAAQPGPGGSEGAIEGLPSPSSPRVTPLSLSETTASGQEIRTSALLTTDEVAFIEAGVIGAQLQDPSDSRLLVIGVSSGGSSYKFPLDVCRGCLIAQTECFADESLTGCRPGQDEISVCSP